MTIEEAKNILINRGFVEINGDQVFDGYKWRNAITVISKWLEQEPCDDCISRQEAINCVTLNEFRYKIVEDMKTLPSVTPKEKIGWIPVSERVPEDTYPVNITWVNHAPVPYYATIKDKPFAATGCYCDGKWYWYSVTCQYYLDEYRYCDADSMAEEIEVIAWMPLPEPYKAESEDKE